MKQFVLSILESFGRYFRLLLDIGKDIGQRGIEPREVTRQIVKIGLNSLPIVVLTAIFTGMVLALQTAYGLNRFGAKNYVGNVTSLAMIRELGPVLTALMLCGRVGAGIAAEIASMVVTEQVDAIRALGANPIRKLVTPKVIAAAIVTPLLVSLANVVGTYGGLLVSVYDLNLTAHSYFHSVLYTVVIRDVIDALIKSFVFGFLVVSLACYRGLQASGGTEGVGAATTSAVVTGSIVILISDFFITKLLIILS
jgi:phospholipid/cholesterol/gamma-HCH transport system permease protein